MSTITKLSNILAEKYGNVGAIDADSIIRDLGIDSMELLELVFDIEDAFDISIPNAQEFITIGDIVKAIDDELK